jgi:molecular chaperone HtpG
MATATQTLPFQAEAKELLDLVVHSLYSQREVFLRELISNASDALDKLRIEALAYPERLGSPSDLSIRLESEPARRVLRVIDNGIGMSRDELVSNLGTIARSGTRRFLQELRAEGPSAAAPSGAAATPQLIGRFGVGFYASFLVAERVVVTSSRAGSREAWRWSSRGDGEFTLEPVESAPRGTAVELFLKPREADDDQWRDYCSSAELARLVRRTSDFIEWPIEMAAAGLEGQLDLPRRRAADGVELVRLNSQKPLWSRPKEQIQPEEYAACYRHLGQCADEPLETIHFKAEGAQEYSALLFVPSESHAEPFEPQERTARIGLYVQRVLVQSRCAELAPPWLRFLVGVVDSQDLPLNVSREILQENRLLRQIRARIEQKVLAALGAMCRDRRADYERFWSAFGSTFKEGIALEPSRAEELADLALFHSSRGGWTTLSEAKGRMAASQTALYVLQGPSAAACERSPHLEALRARGLEALLASEPVDEWVFARLERYRDVPILQLQRVEPDWESSAERETRLQRERELRGVLEDLESALEGRVDRVQLSARLVESPAVLVDEADSPPPHLARLMEQRGQGLPPRRRRLELAAQPGLLARLERAREQGRAALGAWAEVLYGQAMLLEGSPLEDAQRFARALAQLLEESTRPPTEGADGKRVA